MGIGWIVNAIEDEKLGAFELHFSINKLIICSIHPADKIHQRDKHQVDTGDWFFKRERFRVSSINLKYILSTAIVATLAVISGISHASRRNAKACTFLTSVRI